MLQLAWHLFQRGACSFALSDCGTAAPHAEQTASGATSTSQRFPATYIIHHLAVSALPRRRWIVDECRACALRCGCSVDCGVAAPAVFVLAFCCWGCVVVLFFIYFAALFFVANFAVRVAAAVVEGAGGVVVGAEVAAAVVVAVMCYCYCCCCRSRSRRGRRCCCCFCGMS